MKAIIAVVRPHIIDKLLSEMTAWNLADIGYVTAVRGYGRQKNYLNEYRGSEYSTAYLPKVFLMLYAADEHVDEIVAKIIEIARTGRMGDGKIFIIEALTPKV